MKGMNMSADEKTVKYAKLDWYKEVLSLEPNSKLFLPLARLLAELGTEDKNADMMNEAFAVLRKGLDIQPEYMEARLFLIELLNNCGCKAQCGAEVARLASLFLSYPDFWDAWREYAIMEHESSDFTAALGFMSAIMRNKSLSIVQVLEAGLNSLKANSAPVFSPETINIAKNIEKSTTAKMPDNSFAQIKTSLDNVFAPQKSAQETARESASFAEPAVPLRDEPEQAVNLVASAVSSASYNAENFTAENVHAEKKMMPSELADVLPKTHVDNYINFAEQQNKIVQDKTKSTKETLAELIKDANITIEPVENSLFRTKSMADLLAEQGDYKGALEIYKELLAKGYGNKDELEERIADIKMLAPELNVEIDKSKLLAIDDLVDTSFGTMAESLSTMQAGNLDLDEVQAQSGSMQAENADAELLDFAGEMPENESLQNENAEPAEQAEHAAAAPAGVPDANDEPGMKDMFAEEQIPAENISQEMENAAAVPSAEEQGKQPEKKAKSQADIADLLTKLAERLEIRAS